MSYNSAAVSSAKAPPAAASQIPRAQFFCVSFPSAIFGLASHQLASFQVAFLCLPLANYR